MKKQVIATALMVLTAPSAFAESSLRLGAYTGQTGDGRQCGVRIGPSEFHEGNTRVDFSWRKDGGGYEAGYVEVKSEDQRIVGDTFIGKSSYDIAVAKLKLTLASDGSPVEAKMGLGMFIKFGYDEICYELIRNL